MVLIHIKKTDLNQFLYQATRDLPIERLIEELCTVYNLRLKIDRGAQFVEDLVKKGPLKPEETRGLSEGEDTVNAPFADHRYIPDETHYRTGWCVPEELGLRILETVQAAKTLIHKSQAENRISVSIDQLSEAFSLMKGAVNMAYPAYHGLPAWEPAMLIFEKEDVQELLQGEELHDPQNTSVWFAGKEMMGGKTLGFYVKGSENTKIIAKMQKAGAGAPVREPLVDAKTQQQMIAWHHKKQEEAKKLMAVDDDEYLNSAWADPRSLKKQLHGAMDIRWR